MDPAEIGDSTRAADDRQRAEISVAEGARRRSACGPASDHLSHVFAVLRGDGAIPEGPAIAAGETGHVADYKDLIVPGDRAIGPDLDRSVVCGISTKPVCRWTRPGTSTPEHVGAFDPLAGRHHPGRINLLDCEAESDLDPECAKRPNRIIRLARRKCG